MQQPPAPLHRKHSLPKWLIAVNVVMMLPILAAPLVFYASIFIFDNPHNMPLAMLVFFAINSYTEGLSPAVMEYIVKTTLCPIQGGHTHCDEIGLPVSATGGVVPCGATAIWEE